jgi:hypothetical protein
MTAMWRSPQEQSQVALGCILYLGMGQKQGRFACAGRLRYTKAQAQTRRGGLMDRLDHVEKDILKGYVLHGSFHLGQPSDS